MMTPSPDARLFFSYARRDGPVAERIFTALTDAGLTVYRDTEQILPAEDWRGRLGGLITKSDGVVFVMSGNSVRSEICTWEVELAAGLNKRIVPVVIEQVSDGDVPAPLARLNYIFATPAHDFAQAISAVVQSCSTDIDWVRTHTTIGERAGEWDQAGRPPRTRILRGDELAEAEAWMMAQPANAPALTSVQRAWIGASRRAASRRQRGWLIGAGCITLASIALGSFAEWNRRIAARERDRAEVILDRGSQTANDLVFDLAQRFRDRDGVPQDLVRDMLQRSRNLIDALAEAGESRPDLARSKAAALAEMSTTLLRQGELDSALSAAREAVAGFAALAAGQPGNRQWQLDLAAGHDRVGDALMALARPDEASAAFDQGRAVAQALMQSDPGDQQGRTALALALQKAGLLALANGDARQALDAFQQATALGEVGTATRERAILLEQTGNAHRTLGNDTAAIAAYRESETMTAALARADPDNTLLARDLSVIHQTLGEMALTEGRTVDALRHFEADTAIARRLYTSDPARTDWARDLMASHDRLASLFWQTGSGEQAADALARAHELARQIAVRETGRAADWDEASRLAQKRSLALFAIGDIGAALAVAQTSADDLRDRNTEPARAAALNNVAWYALFSAAPDRAVAAALAAREIDPDQRGYRVNHAHALLLAGRTEEAHTLYSDADTPDGRALIADDFTVLRDAGIMPTPIEAMAARLGIALP